MQKWCLNRMKFRRDSRLENGWVIKEKQRCSKQRRNNRHSEEQRQVGEPVLVKHQSAMRYPCMARTPRGSAYHLQELNSCLRNGWITEWMSELKADSSTEVHRLSKALHRNRVVRLEWLKCLTGNGNSIWVGMQKGIYSSGWEGKGPQTSFLVDGSTINPY